MLNKVFLIGNLGEDPMTRYTQDGTCVCNIRIATSEKFKNRAGEQQERTEWHTIVLWAHLGQTAETYLSKGSRVFIEGKIQTRKWQDREGQDRYSTEIRATELKMLGGGRDRSAGSGDSSGSGDRPASKPKGQDPFAAAPDFGDVPVDDDIPF